MITKFMCDITFFIITFLTLNYSEADRIDKMYNWNVNRVISKDKERRMPPKMITLQCCYHWFIKSSETKQPSMISPKMTVNHSSPLSWYRYRTKTICIFNIGNLKLWYFFHSNMNAQFEMIFSVCSSGVPTFRISYCWMAIGCQSW